MIGNRYKYGLVDLSYLLTRNLFACARNGVDNLKAGDVVKMTIQTLNKIPRDYGITVDKYIFIKDTWSKELGGYYRTSILSGNYKSDRVYMTKYLLDKILEDPTKTDEEKKKAKDDYTINQVKLDAKRCLLENLGQFGIPSLSVEGWEYDDIVYLSSGLLFDIDDKPSVIITKDSDLQYSLTPKMDFFRLPVGGSAPRVITYDEMYEEIPESLRSSINLYQFKALSDSLGFGHNRMLKSIKDGVSREKAMENIVLRNDFSDLADPDLFKRQYDSFNIFRFPGLDEATRIVKEEFPRVGGLGSPAMFTGFCEENGIEGISSRYFSELINRFDTKLFGNG